MALAPCRECGREISSEALVCPHCGVAAPYAKPIDPATERAGRVVGWGCAGLAVVFLGWCAIAIATQSPSPVPDTTQGAEEGRALQTRANYLTGRQMCADGGAVRARTGTSDPDSAAARYADIVGGFSTSVAREGYILGCADRLAGRSSRY